jgi:hypothetical protein
VDGARGHDLHAGAAVTDRERAMTESLEARFGPFTTCSRCDVPLCGAFERRLYRILGGAALVALCDSCKAALPPDSRADIEFQLHLERNGLLLTPPQGCA